MKKFVLLTILIILCLTFAFPAFADFENPPIVDNAGFLTNTELNELSQKLDSIREKYKFDVSVYTEPEMSGFDAQSTADDIFDYNGYGYGDGKDGMIFYISKNPRNYHFSTHGSGLTAFNERGLSYIEGSVLTYLKTDDYYLAINNYIEHSEELLEMAKQGKPYNEKQNSTESIIIIIVAALLIPLFISLILLSIQMKKMNTAVKQDYAASYMKPGSMNLSLSRDIFLFSTITKTKKPKQNSASHTSSSGETHGGRGGSY